MQVHCLLLWACWYTLRRHCWVCESGEGRGWLCLALPVGLSLLLDWAKWICAMCVYVCLCVRRGLMWE